MIFFFQEETPRYISGKGCKDKERFCAKTSTVSEKRIWNWSLEDIYIKESFSATGLLLDKWHASEDLDLA
jgi:hypothetical protein